MRLKILAIAVIVLGMMAAAAWSADINGKWVAQFPGRGGETMQSTFNFKVDGTNLTGTNIGPMGNENQISEGKINGDDISFVVKVDFGGNEMKILYKGKVAGDEIKLTMEFQGGMGGPGGGGPGGGKPMEMTLKRAK